MEDNIKDQISELPEFIVHSIMSLLDSPKDLVRMSVLSKNWFDLTASFPVLNFNIHTFNRLIKPSGVSIFTNKPKREIFIKYVEYTVSRFCKQNMCVHTVKLITKFQDPTDVEIIDRFFRLILMKGVKVLVIDIDKVPNVQQPCQVYRLPNLHLSASSLTSLTLAHCELPSSMIVDDVKFKSLKVLHLQWVTLNEEVFKHLTTGCHLLEELTIGGCSGLKRICAYGLLNLQKVEIRFKRELEWIDIESPNVSYLFLLDSDKRGLPRMNLASCYNLTRLKYSGYPSTTWGGLIDLSSNFPFLETLILHLPDDCKSLNLSSHSLKMLEVNTECDLDKVDINAPNLLFFGCTDGYFSMETDSVPSKACFECQHNEYVTFSWFLKLRRFLDKNTGFEELKLHFNVNCVDFEELKVIQWPPFELEHIELEVWDFESLLIYEAVVDSLLWCCRPRSLTLHSTFPCSTFEEWTKIVKFTYEKLLQQEEDLGHINIQIVFSSSTSEKQYSDLHSLLTALPCDQEGETVTFVKEEIVQEDAVKRFANMEISSIG